MKKLYFILITCFATVSVFGQVGINTTDPKAQLEIKSSNETTPTITDGLLIPKVTAFPAANPTAAQNGMLVYLASSFAGNPSGFYYWNNLLSKWTAIGNNNNTAWNLSGNGGTNPATQYVGTSDNTDLVLRTDKIDNFRIKNDGRIEIGNKETNPVYLGATSLSKKIFVATENSTNNIVLQSSNSNGDPVSMYFGGSKGTILVPTISEVNQNLSNLFFSGYDGTKFINSSGIHAQLDGSPGLNSMPGRLDFRTTPSAATNPLVRMVIRSGGNVGIGVESPTQKLQVNGNIRMVDGNEAEGRVLTSDINGTATWKNPIGITNGTLDQAYDFGGAGLGKTITADAGAVLIDGTDGLVSTGILGSGTIVPSGAGIRMVWNPRKRAFRAGSVNGAEWDDSNVGIGSFAFGDDTQATGIYSAAFGNDTTASAPQSTAFGFYTTASGTNSTAFGSNTNATGIYSTAFGFQSNASGIYSTASGNSSTANGNSSIAMGDNCSSTALASTTFGSYNIANGIASTAFGADNRTIGDFSTAFGNDTTAIGSNSTAFGKQNSARSYSETVFGIGATVYTPTINGNTQYRTANATDRLLVVGNAIDANNNDAVDTAERSDALVILKNGNTGIGASNPLDVLHVVGHIRMVDGNQAAGKIMVSNANGTATWQTNSATNAWGLAGNASTNTTNNFIGTTDNVDFIFRRNNVRAGLLGSSNTSFGLNALNPSTTGTSNTAIGRSTLENNTTGINNTANGRSALETNTAGTNNTATGYQALFVNTEGNNNTAIGVLALDSNITGDDNTALGRGTLVDNTIGNSNTAIGKDALFNSTSNNNTAVGRGTLSGVTTGDNNTAIGFNAQVANPSGDNQVRIGNAAVANANVQVAWTITSDSRWKSNIQKSNLGLDFIKQLNPVFYTRKDVSVSDEKITISETTTNPTTEYGFIAQELEETLAKFDTKNNGIITKDDAGMYGVRYNDLIAPMVKAIQEQQAIIDEQSKTIETILKRLEKLENKNKSLTDSMK